MAKIFISYRREDSAGFAGRLCDALEARYGAGNVFRDIEDIQAGEDFVRALDAQMQACDVVIAIIGHRWLGARSGGTRRIDDDEDTLRLEIHSALGRALRIIPALVDGAVMPAVKELPADIAELARRQALVLNDRSWNNDVESLIEAIGEPVSPRADPSPEATDGKDALVPGTPHARRSGFFALLVVISLALAGAGVWYFSRLPELGGRWEFDDGSSWRVQQRGHRLLIDELHYQSRQVWRRGSATLRNRDIDVELAYVFQPGASLKGTLRLSEDGRSISGLLTELPSGRRVPLSVHR